MVPKKLGRRVVLVVVAATALVAPPASANHAAKELISTGPRWDSEPFHASFAAVSDDGNRAFFHTGEQLVDADANSATDIYERSGGTTTLVSAGQDGTAAGGFLQHVSPDGNRVIFGTRAQLAPEDTDGEFDIYERFGGVNTLISTGPAGASGANPAQFEDASVDGTHVVFATAEALVPADTDGQYDIYVRSGGTTSLVSVGPAGGNDATTSLCTINREGAVQCDAHISRDGTRIIFTTQEQLAETDLDARTDVYEWSAGTTTLLSVGPIGGNADTNVSLAGSFGSAGEHVFYGTAERLVVDDTDGNGADLYEHFEGETRLVSTGPSGDDGNHFLRFAGASADGSRAFFVTSEALVLADTDAHQDVYERSGGVTELISTGPSGGNGPFDVTGDVHVSADGSRVFFGTEEALVAEDADAPCPDIGGRGCTDIYERSGGTTRLVSTGPSGGNGRLLPELLLISDDGSRVFFRTRESLVPEDNDPCPFGGCMDIYERFAGGTTLISGPPTDEDLQRDICDPSTFCDIGLSKDGSRFFFPALEQFSTLDTDLRYDVYAAVVTNYGRPLGAAAVRLPFVLAYDACEDHAANRTHGPSLTFPSCAAPVPASDQLTVGTPDANEKASRGSGLLKLNVCPSGTTSSGVCATPGGITGADLRLEALVTDVRRQSNLTDYTGELRAVTTLRITDRNNSPDPAGSGPGTVADTPFAFAVPCAATDGAADIGATCSVVTHADAVIPGAVVGGKRSIWQLSQVELHDGGPDGDADTPDNRPFLRQGVFVP